MQPVYVDDLAGALVAALSAPAAARRHYNVSGKEALSYNEIVRITAELLGRRVWMLHFPYRPAVRVLGFLERRKITLPIKAEQVLRLNEDKDFDWADAARDLSYCPHSFREAMQRQIMDTAGLR